jgi:hypothetical protein
MGIHDVFDERVLLTKLSQKVNKVTVSEEPNNMFKLAEYPTYNVWNTADKEKIKKYTSSISKTYGYEL